MARVIIAAVFFVLIMTLGATAVGFQGETVGKNYDIDGEVVSPGGAGFAADEQVNLTNSYIDNAVYDSSDQIAISGENGNILVEGTDYTWHKSNGTFTVIGGGDLEGDSTATINYSFHTPTAQQRELETYVGAQFDVASAMVYAFAAIIGVVFLKLLVEASP